jgi:hypothetical protein
MGKFSNLDWTSGMMKEECLNWMIYSLEREEEPIALEFIKLFQNIICLDLNAISNEMIEK